MTKTSTEQLTNEIEVRGREPTHYCTCPRRTDVRRGCLRVYCTVPYWSYSTVLYSTSEHKRR